MFGRHVELFYEKIPQFLIRRYIGVGELIFDIVQGGGGQIAEDMGSCDVPDKEHPRASPSMVDLLSQKLEIVQTCSLKSNT